jgi:hypothetical protein
MGADKRIHIEVEATSAINAVERVQKGLQMWLNMASISDEAFLENAREPVVTITSPAPTEPEPTQRKKRKVYPWDT